MSYEPQPGSVPANVVGYLRNHPGARLTIEHIADLFQLGGKASNLHTLMAKALEAELVRRGKNEDGDYEYFAGPHLGVVSPMHAIASEQGDKKKPRPVSADIDPDKLEICNDAPMPSRARPGWKYGPVFDKLKPGQCIKCEPNQAPTLATALKKWVTDKKLPCIVRATSRYSDGKGRVWLLAEPAKASASPKVASRNLAAVKA